MNFWIIFLCLVVGCVIGYEFGKYTVANKLKSILDEIGENLKREVEKQKADQEQKKKEAITAMRNLMDIFEQAKKMKKEDETIMNYETERKDADI